MFGSEHSAQAGNVGTDPMASGNPRPGPSVHSAAMAIRYQCYACGNRTRFDVVVTRRSAAYYHFTIGGERAVEEETVLDEHVESVRCRWCGADDDRVAAISVDELESVGAPNTESV